jgi:thiol:disulfide interchange protein DsbA
MHFGASRTFRNEFRPRLSGDDRMKRYASQLMIFALCLFAATAARAAPGDPRLGIDYARIGAAQPQSGPGVEVVEFFSYGCPHCNEVEPVVSRWRAALPKDVHFKRIPISFGNPKWIALSKLYLAIESTGDLAKLDREVFSAVHAKGSALVDEKTILEWASARVADPKKFIDMYRSFDVEARTRRAEQTGASFGIPAIPSMAVGGRYLVTAEEAKNFQDLLRVTDKVIEMARREGKSPAR